MKLKATFYYTGSGTGATFRTVEVVGIHKPRLGQMTRSSTGKLTLFGHEITDNELPQFKTYHIAKCFNLSITLEQSVTSYDVETIKVNSIAEVLRDLLNRAEQEGV